MTNTDAIVTAAIRTVAERLDKDVRGAYRAGYTHLYVGHPRLHPPAFPSLDDAFHTVTLPTHTTLPTSALPDDYQWDRYDLDSVSVEEYREALGHD